MCRFALLDSGNNQLLEESREIGAKVLSGSLCSYVGTSLYLGGIYLEEARDGVFGSMRSGRPAAKIGRSANQPVAHNQIRDAIPNAGQN